MTDTELREWAEAHAAGTHRSPVAVAVLVMLGDNLRLRQALQSAATRIADQSEILSRRAEVPIADFYEPVSWGIPLPGTHC